MWRWAGLLVLAGMLAAGCGARTAGLQGTSWRLTAWTLSSLRADAYTITAQFDDGRIGGQSAVNQYGGPVTLGPGNAFAVGEVVSTLMAGPEDAMRAEQAYLELLRGARSYALDGDTLTLFDAGGNPSLIFEAATG